MYNLDGQFGDKLVRDTLKTGQNKMIEKIIKYEENKTISKKGNIISIHQRISEQSQQLKN